MKTVTIKAIPLYELMQDFGVTEEQGGVIGDEMIESDFRIAFEDGEAGLIHASALVELKTVASIPGLIEHIKSAETPYFIIGVDTLPLEVA